MSIRQLVLVRNTNHRKGGELLKANGFGVPGSIYRQKNPTDLAVFQVPAS